MASTAPATSSNKETTNYARLCRLLVDVGTQALKDTLDVIHTPATLHSVLAAKKLTLQGLRSRRIINATQWGKLFPVIPSAVSSKTFDITLLTILLRNLGGLPSPITGWDTLPAATDMSSEAHIARLKYFRNTVYAHAEQASVDDTTFNAYWQDIRDTLVRLGGVRYREAIDNLETECMDPEMEHHYKQVLSEWKKDEGNIKDELKEIGTKMTDVMKKLDDLTAATVTNREESRDEGTSSELEELVETSVICREKHHENKPLNYYCQNCKVCICDKCGQTRHANHTKMDIKQATEEQKLKMAELVQEMKVEINEHTTQMEKTTEILKKNGAKTAAARIKVLTTVEELIRVLKEHEIAMVTKLDVIENEQQRDYSAQLEHFQICVTQLKTSVECCERILEGNNSVEILEANQGVMEKCKGLLNARKMNIFKPLHVQYKTNEEDIQNFRRAFLGEVFVSTTDPLQTVAEGKGLKQAEAGREASLTITTKNAEGEQCYNEIDEIIVKVRSPSQQDLNTNIADNEDGKYSVTYTPECDGHHDVVIEVNCQPLTSSPWSVHVKPHQYHAVRSFGPLGKAKGKFDFPYDIAINAKTGNIAVADSKNKRVQLFSSDGIYLREYGQKGFDAKTLDFTLSVAFNSSGDVTMCDSSGIFCYTENGEFIKNISSKHLIKPENISIDCDGRMLVCDRGDNTVKVLSPDGAELLRSITAPGCNESPRCALRHQDRLFVSYTYASCVKVFNNEGEFLYDIGTEGPGKLECPVGLAVDKFNNLIVCSYGNVQVFTLEGKFVNSIKEQPTQLQRPSSVAVWNAGQVFITDRRKDCVHVFE